ncbi:hypothetical protein B0A52_09184 [Exophiala mesophila]|uniref:Uncharacterized protein n=1 Tax=Exophiala mesophila TaxID=212818 RepID=A0A438MTE1_EXOME|nr:hypothetical protein B0A52_09184 [Exophiala mesophila]
MNEKLPVSATGLEFQSWGPMKQTLEGHASVATIRDQAEANPSERDPESQSSSRIIHREGVAEATCAPELGELCNGAQDFNGGDELARPEYGPSKDFETFLLSSRSKQGQGLAQVVEVGMEMAESQCSSYKGTSHYFLINLNDHMASSNYSGRDS